MKIIIAGGGTGGHLYPGIALAEYIKKKEPNSKILFLVNRKQKNILMEKFDFSFISAEGLPSKINLGIIKSSFFILIGIFQSLFIILKFKPDVVFGLGSYLSFPPIFVAHCLKIQCFIQEQNYIPGRANLFLSRFAKKIFVSFEDTKKYFPEDIVVFSGNPVREIGVIEEEKIKEKYGLNKKDKIILVFGGSKGAKSINNAIIETIPFLKGKDVQIIHITGRDNYEEVKTNAEKVQGMINYILIDYLDNILSVMKIADLVVCRAGATTCAELTLLGKPSILIPYPYAIHNHQKFNAKFLEEKGAAKYLEDKNLSGEKLSSIILEIIENPFILKEMAEKSKILGKQDSKEIIFNFIKEVANK